MNLNAPENCRLSVIVISHNTRDLLEECLSSAQQTAGELDIEILVVDSYSTDRTLEMARNYTERIVQRDYVNSANQKNWSIEKATYKWVYIIDADERMSNSLKEEIADLTIMATQKLINENLDSKKSKGLVDQYLKDLSKN